MPESEWHEAVSEIRGKVLAVGTHERDYETLVEAADGIEGKIHIICDLSVHRPIEKSGVVWHDSMPMSQFVEAIRQSRLVVVPLRPAERNFGQMGVVLPMALGKPVVATEVEALKDHVIPGRTGELVPPSNPSELREAIVKLMEAPDLCNEYGREAAVLERELSAVAKVTIDSVIDRVRGFHSMKKVFRTT